MLKIVLLILSLPFQAIPSPDTLFISGEEEYYLLDSLLQYRPDIDELTVAIIGNYDAWVLYDGPEGANTRPVFKYPVHLTNVPEQLLQFSELRYLDLTSLGLRALPEEMSVLTKLEVLDLSFNYLDYQSTITVLESLPSLRKVIIHAHPWENPEINAFLEHFSHLEIVSTRKDYWQHWEEMRGIKRLGSMSDK